MGRSYWFECSRCGYRAKVSGGADRGLDFYVQTIVCLECVQLYDAVTRLRVSAEASQALLKNVGVRRARTLGQTPAPVTPPTFLSAVNRLPRQGVRKFKWAQFKPQCPVSPIHRIQIWNEPGKCPKCGLHLEKGALPYRIWD